MRCPLKSEEPEIARTAGAIDWLQGVVATLTADEVSFGVEAVETTDRYGGALNVPDAERRVVRSARPSTWIALLMDERRHLVRVCKAAISCGVAEQQVRVLEEQGRIIAHLFRRIEGAPELSWTEGQRAAFRRVAIRELSTALESPVVTSGEVRRT